MKDRAKSVSLSGEYERTKQSWNSFWSKLIAKPDSPMAHIWLDKFNECGKQMVANLQERMSLVEEMRKFNVEP